MGENNKFEKGSGQNEKIHPSLTKKEQIHPHFYNVNKFTHYSSRFYPSQRVFLVM